MACGHFSAVELGNASVSGDLADPDGDGFGNLLEFAFALAPWSHDATANLPALGSDAGSRTLGYRERTDATGLRYDFQVSDTPLNWITVNEPVILSTAALGGASWKTLRDPASAASQAQRFLRLRVLEAGSVPTLFLPPDTVRLALEIPLRARLQWTDQTTLETGYIIERKTGSGAYALAAISGPDVNRLIDTEIAGSTTYTYRVRAVDGASFSAYSAEITLTTPLDSDGDGLPDDWENRHSLNPWLFSSNGSGISDGYLWNWGFPPGSFIDPDSDDDGDGLTLGEEAQLDTNPASSDTDKDGNADGADLEPNGRFGGKQKRDGMEFKNATNLHVERNHDAKLDLTWAPPLATRLTSYEVYRSLNGAAWERVDNKGSATPPGESATQWTDNDAPAGSTYHYVIKGKYVNFFGSGQLLTGPSNVAGVMKSPSICACRWEIPRFREAASTPSPRGKSP